MLTLSFRKIDLAALVLVLAGVIFGVRQRAGLPAIPLLTPDSWGYLHPALAWLGGAGFQQTDGRAWFYPAILALTIKLGGDFSWIVRLQQFLSLAGAPLLWLTIRVWLSVFPERSRFCHGFAVFFGVIASWIYLFNTTQVRFEFTIQPEGVLAFFVLGYLVCALAYFRARWCTRSLKLATLFGTASFLLSCIVLLLKPSWGLAIIPSFLVLMAGAFGSAPRPLRFIPVCGGFLTSIGLFFAPGFLGFKPDSGSRSFLPFTLVSIHAAQIVQNAARHHLLDPANPSSNDHEFYRQLDQAWQEARKVPLRCRTLGFSPDDIMYTKDFFGTFQAGQHLSNTELINLCYSAYLRTWVQSPGAMLAKIGKEVAVFISTPAADFSAHSVNRHRALDMAARFSPSLQTLTNEAESRDYLEHQAAYRSYLQNLEAVYQRGWQVNCVNWLRYVAVVIAKLSSLIQLAFFGALIFVFLRRTFSPLRMPGLAATIVIAAVYGNMLTIAIVHSLDVDRYRTSYTPPLLVALVIMSTFLISCAERGSPEARRNSR